MTEVFRKFEKGLKKFWFFLNIPLSDLIVNDIISSGDHQK